MKLTKLTALVATTALCAPMAVIAEEMANEMTVVSWGGAYSKSATESLPRALLGRTPVSPS